MKSTIGSIEVSLSDEVIEDIALKIVGHLRPLLVNNVRGEDELLTVDEAAALLKRSKATVYELVNDAKHGLKNFPYVKQGRRLRFSKHALLTWNCENETGTKG